MDIITFLLMIELCLIISFLIPAVSAFPVGPWYASAGGLTFTSTFPFPGVPLREGVRRIHTLEHLLNVTVHQGKGVGFSRYMEITGVSQPHRYGDDHVTVGVQCKIRGVDQTIFLIGRPKDKRSSTIMCVRDGTQRMMVDLRVSRLLYEEGHSLTARCTYLRARRAIDHDMDPVLRYIRIFGRHPTLRAPEHPNLQWYRRLVLGLDRFSEDDGYENILD